MREATINERITGKEKRIKLNLKSPILKTTWQGKSCQDGQWNHACDMIDSNEWTCEEIQIKIPHVTHDVINIFF